MEENCKNSADSKKIKFRLHLLSSKREKNHWIIIITIFTFILSSAFSLISSTILSRADTIIVSIFVVLSIIIIGIVFDIIGTAATAANEAPFHAMASRKVYGAKQAIWLIRNADRVSNFCNDVIGDICGVISGAASVYIISSIAKVIRITGDPETSLAGLSVTGLLASLTVGGKALGKSLAIENSNYFIYKVAVVLQFIFGKFGIIDTKKKKSNHGNRKER